MLRGDDCPRCGAPTILLLYSRVCRAECDRAVEKSPPIPAQKSVEACRGFLRYEVIDGIRCAVFRADIEIDVPPGATHGQWKWKSGGWKGLTHRLTTISASDTLRSGAAVDYVGAAVTDRAYWTAV